MNKHKDLRVWKNAINFAVKLYPVLELFPDSEKFGLISQMKRSVISIASNIAEGAGRNSPKEFNYFLGISYGSAAELETQIIVANKLNFIQDRISSELITDLQDIQKMIYGLQKSIKK